MARLHLDRLDVRFGEVTAVDRIALDIADGEFVVFLGPSGCGKTTTLRCIAGLETPTNGDIRFDGLSVLQTTPAQRNVAMVFQFVSLYPHLNVGDNIAFPLRARGMARAEIRRRVEWVSELFGLGDMLKRHPKGLPPGIKQRVALARAVIRDPDVLLLDEPLSAIDERFREEMRWELGHLQKQLGVTTIYVTHDQREAMSLADRIVVMADGQIRQADSARNVYNTPADEFVGYFVGSPPMNFVDARLAEGRLELGRERLPLELPADVLAAIRAAAPQPEMRLGIRPQHVHLGEPPSLAAGARLQPRILDRYRIGRAPYFDFGIDDEIFTGIGDAEGEAPVTIDTRHLLLYARDGGLRIPMPVPRLEEA